MLPLYTPGYVRGALCTPGYVRGALCTPWVWEHVRIVHPGYGSMWRIVHPGDGGGHSTPEGWWVGILHPGYVGRGIPPCVHPSYTTLGIPPSCCTPLLRPAGLLHDLGAERWGLGSTFGIIREDEAQGASLSPKVWEKKGASARSYSALPVINRIKIG